MGDRNRRSKRHRQGKQEEQEEQEGTKEGHIAKATVPLRHVHRKICMTVEAIYALMLGVRAEPQLN